MRGNPATEYNMISFASSVDPSCSREDLEMEDGTDGNNPLALNCALHRPEGAENPTGVDGNHPRRMMLGLCLLPVAIAASNCVDHEKRGE